MKETNSRKQRERRRHLNEILSAAEEVFAEKGFHRTTMEDVSVRSEFAVGTLYSFFPGKEQLYHSLIKQRCRQLRDEAYQAMDEAQEPSSVIKAYIKAKIVLSKKYFAFTKLYTRERLGDRFTDSELWWKTVAPIYEEVMARLTQAFQEGIEQGYFRCGLDPVEMTTALEGITDGFMYQWLMFPDKHSFKDKLETMIRLFFKGISKE